MLELVLDKNDIVYRKFGIKAYTRGAKWLSQTDVYLLCGDVCRFVNLYQLPDQPDWLSV